MSDVQIDTSAVPDFQHLARLDDQTHLVVGAGQGIGRQVAHALAQGGAHVVCLDNEAARAEAVAQEVGGTALVGNVLDEGQVVASLAAAATAGGGSLNGVVDIVGMARFRSLVEASEEDWTFMFDMVLKHARWLVKHGAAHLARTSGSLTFVSSIAALTGAQGNGPYAAAKAALVSLVRTAAVELAPGGIRVNSVAPSVVLTPRMRQLLDPERLERFNANTPLGRLADPSEVASALLFLSSGAASYITGQTLVLDGGVQARLPYPDFI